MRAVLLSLVLVTLFSSPVVAKDKQIKKKQKKPVKVALLMPEDLRNVVTIETSHNTGLDELDSNHDSKHQKLGHYGHPPNDCEKDEVAVQINGKLMALTTTEYKRM